MKLNLRKNSLINYCLSFICQQKKSNIEKLSKDLVWIIFSFLGPIKMTQLCRIAPFFNDFVNEYKKLPNFLKDLKAEHIRAIEQFEEQKNLLPKKSEKNSQKMQFHFGPVLNGCVFGGMFSHLITGTFQSIDQTEVFMETSYRQFYCSRTSHTLENYAAVMLVICLVGFIAKMIKICASSLQEENKLTLAEQKVSRTHSLYLKKREETKKSAIPQYFNQLK